MVGVNVSVTVAVGVMVAVLEYCVRVGIIASSVSTACVSVGVAVF